MGNNGRASNRTLEAKTMRKALTIFAVSMLASLMADAQPAQAQYMGPAWNYLGGGWTYPFYVNERVPFYSTNPPVYYSLPRARSYGHSPFPYPAALWPVPQMRVANPYALGAPQIAASEPAAPKPQVVKNPYVK